MLSCEKNRKNYCSIPFSPSSDQTCPICAGNPGFDVHTLFTLFFIIKSFLSVCLRSCESRQQTLSKRGRGFDDEGGNSERKSQRALSPVAPVAPVAPRDDEKSSAEQIRIRIKDLQTQLEDMHRERKKDLHQQLQVERQQRKNLSSQNKENRMAETDDKSIGILDLKPNEWYFLLLLYFAFLSHIIFEFLIMRACVHIHTYI